MCTFAQKALFELHSDLSSSSSFRLPITQPPILLICPNSLHAVEFSFKREIWLGLLWINKHLFACKRSGLVQHSFNELAPSSSFPAAPSGTPGFHTHCFFLLTADSCTVPVIYASGNGGDCAGAGRVNSRPDTLSAVLLGSLCLWFVNLFKQRRAEDSLPQSCTAVVTLIATIANWIYL